MAKLVATRSTCLRRAVGCVLVNERGHVLATGYNGVAAGQPHCNATRNDREYEFGAKAVAHPHACAGAEAPTGTALDACQAIHAEQNALLQCRDVFQIHTCYCTTMPCVTCAKLLLNTACRRIVYQEAYPTHEEAVHKLWFSGGSLELRRTPS
jgi:dCMP deaminase